MLMGMSAGTFWGGLAGSEAFTAKIEKLSGLPVSTGSTSTAAALRKFGVKRIGVFSPYQPVADVQVAQADALEGYLGKPVIPINVATLWHAMRAMGFDDKLDGAGRLFREF